MAILKEAYTWRLRQEMSIEMYQIEIPVYKKMPSIGVCATTSTKNDIEPDVAVLGLCISSYS